MTATVKLQLKFQCKFDPRDPGQVSWVEQMIGALDPDLDPKLYSLQHGSFSADLPDEEETMPEGWMMPENTNDHPEEDAKHDDGHEQVPGTEFKVTGVVTAVWDPTSELELAWIQSRLPAPYGTDTYDDTVKIVDANWDEMNGEGVLTVEDTEVMWRKVA